MEYKAGDVVQDMERGTKMTVERHTLDGVECVWFTQCPHCYSYGEHVSRGLFLPRQLILWSEIEPPS